MTSDSVSTGPVGGTPPIAGDRTKIVVPVAVLAVRAGVGPRLHGETPQRDGPARRHSNAGRDARVFAGGVADRGRPAPARRRRRRGHRRHVGGRGPLLPRPVRRTEPLDRRRLHAGGHPSVCWRRADRAELRRTPDARAGTGAARDPERHRGRHACDAALVHRQLRLAQRRRPGGLRPGPGGRRDRRVRAAARGDRRRRGAPARHLPSGLRSLRIGGDAGAPLRRQLGDRRPARGAWLLRRGAEPRQLPQDRTLARVDLLPRLPRPLGRRPAGPGPELARHLRDAAGPPRRAVPA